jgi:hypothetical protein
MVRERRVYVEKRQADNVRARRFSSIDTHTETPGPRLARAHTTTLVTVARLFCETQPADFSPCLGEYFDAAQTVHQTTGALT